MTLRICDRLYERVFNLAAADQLHFQRMDLGKIPRKLARSEFLASILAEKDTFLFRDAPVDSYSPSNPRRFDPCFTMMVGHLSYRVICADEAVIEPIKEPSPSGNSRIAKQPSNKQTSYNWDSANYFAAYLLSQH